MRPSSACDLAASKSIVTLTQVTSRRYQSTWPQKLLTSIWRTITRDPLSTTNTKPGRENKRQSKAPDFTASYPQIPSTVAKAPRSEHVQSSDVLVDPRNCFGKPLKIQERLRQAPQNHLEQILTIKGIPLSQPSGYSNRHYRILEGILSFKKNSKRSRKLLQRPYGEVVRAVEPRIVTGPPLTETSGRIKKEPTINRMYYWLQFVTVPTVDTPGSLLAVHFDDGQYLFGDVAEGTQRACIEHGIRNVKTREVFLTGKTQWKNTGGLLGLILSMGDVQQRQEDEARAKAYGKAKSATTVANRLGIHGGPNLLHTLAVGRRFIFRKNMPLNVNEFKELAPRAGLEPTWTDVNIKVWQIGVSTNVGERDWSQKTEEDDLRKSIISLMFDSDWRTDALMEQRLKDCNDVSHIFVRNPSTRAIEKYQGPKPQSPDADPDLVVLTRKPWPGALVPSLPRASTSDVVMSYIVKSHNQRGQFNAKKATELGVKPGPLFGKLTQGESVQVEDGTVVRPDMVMGVERPGSGFAVISLPSEEYIADLLGRPEWSTKEVMEGIDSFYWQLGSGLSTDPRILKFCERFASAKHFVMSSDHCPNEITFDSAATNAIKLSRVAPEQFKVPVHDNVSALGRQNHLFSSSDAMNGSPFIPAAARVKLQIGPEYKVLEEAVQPLNTKQIVEEIPAKALQLAKQGKKRIEEQRDLSTSTSELPGGDAEIITLGTGSSAPSKYRSLSGTLVRVPGYGSYLLDCGEGTLGQLQRVFEPQELVEVLRDLKLIWISHLHADHQLGTISVIRAWHEAVHGPLTQDGQPTETSQSPKDADILSRFSRISASDPRLAIVSHSDMLNMLFEYSTAENFGFDKCLPLQALINGGREEERKESLIAISPKQATDRKVVPPEHPILHGYLGLKKLSFCKVSHCYGAMAVSFEFDNGFKVSYSGDCRPSKQFAEIGAGSTVLIHEATFDDELQGEASAKKHSTTSEAIGVGAAMGAKGVILTHFSQRYAKMPIMSTLHPLQVNFEDAVAEPETAEVPLEIPHLDTNNAQNVGTACKDPDVPMTEPSSQSDVSMGLAEQPPSESGFKAAGPSLTTYVEPATTSSKETAVLSNDMKVCVAFDYMRIRVDQIADMVHYTPALTELFNVEKVINPDTDTDDEGPSAKQTHQTTQAQQNHARESTSKSNAAGATNSESKGSSQPQSNAQHRSDLSQDPQDPPSTPTTKAQLRRDRKRLARQERKAAAAAAQRNPSPTTTTTTTAPTKASKRKPPPSTSPSPRHRRLSPSPRTAQPGPPHPHSSSTTRRAWPATGADGQSSSSRWDNINDTVTQQVREEEAAAAAK